MPIRQSMCYPILKPGETTFDELFSLCSEIGYEAVEMWMREDNFDDVVKSARGHGLQIASMIGSPVGLNDRSQHEQAQAELRESIDIAHEHGIPGLICLAGNRLPHLGDTQAIEATADGFRRVAGYAEEKGVNLNLEVLNSKIDHPGYQCDHTAWATAVCERVNSPRVKMLYDIYHMQIMEGDIIRTIRENIKWIGHFHTAGNPGRNQLDNCQELNYVGICKAIADTGYDLYVGHEFAPTGAALESNMEDDGHARLRSVEQALRYAFSVCNQ